MLRTLRIGTQIGPFDPFWVQVREAVYQKAQQLGIDLVSIELPEYPAILPLEEQASLLEEFLAQELDVLIALNLSDDLICHILDNGLPVISLIESDIQHPAFVSPRGLYDAVHIVGDYFAVKLNGRGRVLCAGGLVEPWGDSGKSRVAGIHDALGEHTEISMTHVPTFWRYEQAVPQLEVALRQFDAPIDAIFGLSDSVAMAARDAAKLLGLLNRHTLIAGINGDPIALAAIAKGEMNMTVETSAEDLGRQAVELAFRVAQGQTLPDHFSLNLQAVTAGNVAEAAAQKLIALCDLPSRLVGVNRQLELNRLTQLETSTAINRRVGSLLDRRQLLQEIANLIRANYGYDKVQVFLWSEQQNLLILVQPDQVGDECITVPATASGILGEALRRNEPIFVPDTRFSRRFPPDPNHPKIRSRVVLPVRVGSKTLGLLDLHSYQTKAHLRLELIGLQSLADQLGIAMQNAELFDDALRARERAEKADRLKTRLLANVGHELRTPLNVILGYSQSALAVPNPYSLEFPPELRCDLERIYHSGEHLLHIINDLLDLSRAEIGELHLFPETIATHSFLEEVFHSMADTASQNDVTWRLSLPERLPVIHTDPVRLRQILLNLLHNAAKFTLGGEIVLAAEVSPPHLHIWVQDTGIGISIELQERIFEPFVTGEHTDRHREGIGLGLSITRRLVALHGGSMTLESQPNQGSTFHIYLPLPNLSDQPLASLEATRPVILLITDRDHPADAIVQLGRQQGLEIRRLHASDDLNTLLQEARPAALAWDLSDASAADWMLIERIRIHPQLCHLPLILYGQEAGETPGLCMGITNILMKPANGKTLVDAIMALRPLGATGPILIVDDDPEARAIYHRLATEALPGYTVCSAENGKVALDWLVEETPSLVILDLLMPEVDGFTVLEKMRANFKTRQVPVLVMSGRMLSYKDVQRLDYKGVVFQSKDLLSVEEAVACLQKLLGGRDLLAQPTSRVVKHTLAYLHQNYSRHLSRQEIAGEVCVSEHYLSKIFRQEIGLTPRECLNRFRIVRAKELLCSTADSITSIAAQVGFDDSAYFSRVFRKYVGQSPKAYRQQPR